MIDVKLVKKKRNLDNIREGKVRIGWFENVRYKDGLPVAQVAVWNEYGTGGIHGIPARPFIRPVVHSNKTKLSEQLKRDYKDALNNDTNTMAVLEKFGLEVRGLIQKQIVQTVSPPNAPITIHGGWMRTATGKPFYVKGKGKSLPLRDTGFMMNSIAVQTEEKKK